MSPLQPNSPRRQAEPQFSRPIQLPDFDMSPASLLLTSALLTSSGASRRGALHRAVMGDEAVDGSPDPSSSWFNLRSTDTPYSGHRAAADRRVPKLLDASSHTEQDRRGDLFSGGYKVRLFRRELCCTSFIGPLAFKPGEGIVHDIASYPALTKRDMWAETWVTRRSNRLEMAARAMGSSPRCP